jgi:hypothetical protein
VEGTKLKPDLSLCAVCRMMCIYYYANLTDVLYVHIHCAVCETMYVHPYLTLTISICSLWNDVCLLEHRPYHLCMQYVKTMCAYCNTDLCMQYVERGVPAVDGTRTAYRVEQRYSRFQGEFACSVSNAF